MCKKLLYLCSLIVLSMACSENPLHVDVSDIEVEVEVKRYDRHFFQIEAWSIEDLKASYPYFFDSVTPDSIWSERRRDDELVYLSERVDSLFPDLNELNAELTTVMKHYAYYFEDREIPQVFTYIGGLDFQYPVIYIDSAAFIALDIFLGGDAPEYQGMPSYITSRFTADFIVPKFLRKMAESHVEYDESDLTLINSMIYWGKVLYFSEAMYPTMEHHRLFEYEKEQVEWAFKNEANMWEYLIREDLLFDKESRTRNRFLDEAPFSKFYAGIDRESPGRVGRWIGWRIVHSYMKSNPDVSLLELLENTDNQAIFAKSNYKPFF